MCPVPDMTRPDEPCREERLRYSDGSERTVFVSDREVPYPEGLLIVSRTGLDGIITHVNDSFVTMSGYEESELVGAPHYILRHPDMPRAAFKDLWSTIVTGKEWQGYVKNLRKDGAFYWVHATVMPNIREGKIAGYTSVRKRAAPADVKAAETLYRQWLAEEGQGQ